MNKIEKINKEQLREDLFKLKPGQTVKITYKFKEKDKEKKQAFEGIVISLKGSGVSATMTIRSLSSGVKMERTIPVHSPNIEKMEILKEGKARRAKLYYLRTAIGKKSRLKTKEITKPSAKKNTAAESDTKNKEGESKEKTE